MKFSEKEKKLIILVAIVAAIAVGLPIVGKQYGNEYLNRETNKRNNLQNELEELAQSLANIEERRRLIQTNRENYLQLVELGVVGNQNPVPWVNLMKEITTRRALNPLSYDFLDEVTHPPGISELTAGSTVNIASWQMSLALPMLHDLDMFMFLSDLKESTKSLFFPIECFFSRVEDEFELINRVNVNSECQVSWVFVKDPAYTGGN